MFVCGRNSINVRNVKFEERRIKKIFSERTKNVTWQYLIRRLLVSSVLK